MFARDLIVKIRNSNNVGQHPQCLGLHRNRYLFSYKDAQIPPPDPISYILRGGRNGKISLYAGRAHGLAIGDELTVYPDKSATQNAPLGTVVIHTISGFQAELKVVDGTIIPVTNAVVAVKPTETPRAVLKLALPPYQHVMCLHSILRSPGRSFQRVISTIPDEAHLSISRNDNSDDFSIQVTDPRVSKYGATPWFRDGSAITPAKLPDVLDTALKYYWELERTDSSNEFPLQHIQTELHELHYVESLFIEGEREVAPVGPNLYQSGEVHLNANSSALRRMYGMKITNHSDTNIHLYICYFFSDELSIGEPLPCTIS